MQPGSYPGPVFGRPKRVALGDACTRVQLSRYRLRPACPRPLQHRDKAVTKRAPFLKQGVSEGGGVSRPCRPTLDEAERLWRGEPLAFRQPFGPLVKKDPRTQAKSIRCAVTQMRRSHLHGLDELRIPSIGITSLPHGARDSARVTSLLDWPKVPCFDARTSQPSYSSVLCALATVRPTGATSNLVCHPLFFLCVKPSRDQPPSEAQALRSPRALIPYPDFPAVAITPPPLRWHSRPGQAEPPKRRFRACARHATRWPP